MANFDNTPIRFFCKGLCLAQPPDAMPEGKFPYLENLRSYKQTALQLRDGLYPINAAALADLDIHSLFRLNDSTPFNGGTEAIRVIGAGTNLYAGVPSGPFTSVASGFSGDPLTGLVAAPVQSVQPYQYVFDSAKQIKLNVAGSSSVEPVGIPAPVSPPDAVLDAPLLNIISDFESAAAWTAAGAVAGAPSDDPRVATTIDEILYDTGSTGWALVAPVSMENIGIGTLLTFDGSETALVTDIKIPVASTTIASIIYDSGASGLCTIQPTASLGTGQVQAANVYADRIRSGYAIARNAVNLQGTPLANPQSATEIPVLRQLDFPVDCLVTVDGELTRILSVAIGQDGVQSFRCYLAGTKSPGDTIAGLPAVRVYLNGTFAAADTVETSSVINTLTPAPAGTPMAGGIQATLSANLAQIGDRATQPDDDLHLSLRVDKLTEVTAVRIYFDVDATTNDFLHNYYYYEADANALSAAVQSANAEVVSTMLTARSTAVQQAQIKQPVADWSSVEKNPQPFSEDANIATEWPTGPVNFGGGASSQSPRSQPIRSAPTTTTPTIPGSTNASPGSLGLGNDQWMEIRFKVGDLQRIGTDVSRTLADVAAVEILVQTTGASTVEVGYDALWLSGGYGADVGEVGVPYVYRHRTRSSVTGAKSNPSPQTRGGVIPRRNRVVLTPATTPAVGDLEDWYRLGGTLTKWTYIGTAPAGQTFYDDFPDSNVDGGDTLPFDLYQPWPSIDLPRRGTCNVAGSAIEWVSGDTFDTNWAPGSIIVVNGVTCTLYAQPDSATLLHINENAGDGSAVEFYLPEPTVLGTNWPCWWGPLGTFYFATGDPNRPGVVGWTHGNDPDSTSDAYYVNVTSAEEPMMNGCIGDGRCFAFSSDDLYWLEPAFDTAARFVPRRTSCGRGLWSKWAMTVTPFGIAFLAKDGIYLTEWGGAARSLTDADLYPLFPHDAVLGEQINGIHPPDMQKPNQLRLTYENGYLVFDYINTRSELHTLSFRFADQSWWYDTYNPGVSVRLWESGEDVNQVVCGTQQGLLFRIFGPSDNNAQVLGLVWTPAVDMGNTRLNKLFSDVALDANAGLSAGILVQPTFNAFVDFQPAQTVFTSGEGRHSEPVDINGGAGVVARSVGLLLQVTSANRQAQLFSWTPSWVAKTENIKKRATDWDDLGYKGAKFVQGVILRGDTEGATKTVQVQYDGGSVALTFDVLLSGEREIAYPATGVWTPFIAQLVRLFPTDTNQWRLYDWRWVYEPAPELATTWIAQPTTFDLPGYLTVHDGVIAHMSTSDLTVTLAYNDGTTVTQTIPHSGGQYVRSYVLFPVGKGKSVQPSITSAQPFRLFKRDCSVRIQGWGLAGGYQVVSPFGGPSRADGAAI